MRRRTGPRQAPARPEDRLPAEFWAACEASGRFGPDGAEAIDRAYQLAEQVDVDLLTVLELAVLHTAPGGMPLGGSQRCPCPRHREEGPR